jgi:hypothetical protein
MRLLKVILAINLEPIDIECHILTLRPSQWCKHQEHATHENQLNEKTSGGQMHGKYLDCLNVVTRTGQVISRAMY